MSKGGGGCSCGSLIGGVFMLAVAAGLWTYATSPATPAGAASTPVPVSSLSVGGVTYPPEVTLGEVFMIMIPVRNGGATTSGVHIQLNGFDHADLTGCVPACAVTNFLTAYADFPGLAAGASASYQVGFVATKLGTMDVLVCVYDPTIRAPCESGTIVVTG